MLVLSGMLQNFLTTFLSVLLPISIGVLLSFFASKSDTAREIFSWISLPFEAICPIVLLVCIYFVFFPFINNPLIAIVFAFTIAFIAYMPARYNKSDSFVKNILYNGLGLISAVYKWSFCVGYIAGKDMLYAANLLRSRTYNNWYYLIPLLVSVIVLLIIELARRLVKNLMK